MIFSRDDQFSKPVASNVTIIYDKLQFSANVYYINGSKKYQKCLEVFPQSVSKKQFLDMKSFTTFMKEIDEKSTSRERTNFLLVASKGHESNYNEVYEKLKNHLKSDGSKYVSCASCDITKRNHLKDGDIYFDELFLIPNHTQSLAPCLTYKDSVQQAGQLSQRYERSIFGTMLTRTHKTDGGTGSLSKSSNSISTTSDQNNIPYVKKEIVKLKTDSNDDNGLRRARSQVRDPDYSRGSSRSRNRDRSQSRGGNNQSDDSDDDRRSRSRNGRSRRRNDDDDSDYEDRRGRSRGRSDNDYNDRRGRSSSRANVKKKRDSTNNENNNNSNNNNPTYQSYPGQAPPADHNQQYGANSPWVQQQRSDYTDNRYPPSNQHPPQYCEWQNSPHASKWYEYFNRLYREIQNEPYQPQYYNQQNNRYHPYYNQYPQLDREREQRDRDQWEREQREREQKEREYRDYWEREHREREQRDRDQKTIDKESNAEQRKSVDKINQEQPPNTAPPQNQPPNTAPPQHHDDRQWNYNRSYPHQPPHSSYYDYYRDTRNEHTPHPPYQQPHGYSNEYRYPPQQPQYPPQEHQQQKPPLTNQPQYPPQEPKPNTYPSPPLTNPPLPPPQQPQYSPQEHQQQKPPLTNQPQYPPQEHQQQQNPNLYQTSPLRLSQQLPPPPPPNHHHHTNGNDPPKDPRL